jgi:toxin-antitoxin system PIN domain toxin
MIAVDTNLLVYSHRSDSPFHQPAKELVETLRISPGPWAIPWPCVHEFVSIVTHPRVFKVPTPLAVAFACVEAWLAGGNLLLIAESDGYLAKLCRIANAAELNGPRIHDARIAALCLHHGVSELWTADRDFSVFPELKTRNPLVEA